jgi:hypothetical protein
MGFPTEARDSSERQLTIFIIMFLPAVFVYACLGVFPSFLDRRAEF